MKKKFTLIAVFCLFTFMGFSQTCPTHFIRTNGNNGGTCASHIKLYFANCPLTLPTLDSVKINGVLQPQTFTVFNAVCNGNSIFIDYCISDINLPPVAQLTIYLTYPGACSGCGTSTICNTPEGAPQPVNLSSFLVGRTGADVSLNWKTEIEMNVVNFEVQRSYDNGSFKTIATVPGNVNGVSIKSYSFVDNTNTSQSMSFYRLKIVKQGEISYSDIKTVKGLAAKADFVIFPNPSVGNAKITISDLSEPTRIQLLDNSGRLVKTLMLNNTNTVELNGLQKGAYMVRIIGSVSGNTETRKLTVIK